MGRLLAELPHSQSLDALLPRALGSDPALAQDRWLADALALRSPVGAISPPLL